MFVFLFFFIFWSPARWALSLFWQPATYSPFVLLFIFAMLWQIKFSLSLAFDLPLRKLNYVLFSSAYSLVRGFLCRKQTCTVTVCDTTLDGPPSVDSTAPAGIDRYPASADNRVDSSWPSQR